MRILVLLSVAIGLCASQLPAQLPGQPTARVLPSDFVTLVGSWEGKLTYVDYTSHKPVTMPARLNIRQLDDVNAFACAHSYPSEPQANSTDTLILRNSGTVIDDETVSSRTILPDGTIEIVTLLKATDGNEHRKALIRHTYTISKSMYRIRKEVLFDGTDEWLQRYEIIYSPRK